MVAGKIISIKDERKSRPACSGNKAVKTKSQYEIPGQPVNDTGVTKSQTARESRPTGPGNRAKKSRTGRHFIEFIRLSNNVSSTEHNVYNK
jgi:hypothetical protein